MKNLMNSGIYVIRHRESGKCYVGRSTNIKNRWDLHKRHTEQKKDRSPLHRAMRKYGYDAFDWEVLIRAPARLHVLLEDRFMKDMGTMVPAGYNVGGAAGGQPSRELLDAMGPEEREAKMAEMRASAAKMHESTNLRRLDPEYEAKFRAAQSESAKLRWKRRKERLDSDPEYAERADAMWKARAAKAQETIRRRIATEPEFADHMHKNRVISGIKARAKDPRTINAAKRRAAALEGKSECLDT